MMRFDVQTQMAADPIIYCLQELTDYRQFERLCTDLMAATGYSSIEPLGGASDKGRDAIHSAKGIDGETTLFAFSVREDWRRKLRQDCRRISQVGHDCTSLVFLCTSPVSATQRDEEVEYVRKSFAWKLDIFGLERFRVLLSTVHPQLIAKYPQIFSPSFFPKSGGIALAGVRNVLVLDYGSADEQLALWLSRRLQIEGYDVWCSKLAPTAGGTIHAIIDQLLRSRAFRFLPLLSRETATDPESISRRVLASSLSTDLLLPLKTSAIPEQSLEPSLRSMVCVDFADGWAAGLAHLLRQLSAAACPRGDRRHDLGLASYLGEPVVEDVPEIVHSNRFTFKSIPEGIHTFSLVTSIAGEAAQQAEAQWAFRTVAPLRVVSFSAPPQELAETHGIRKRMSTSWRAFPAIEGIASRDLVVELLRKAIEVEYQRKGLVRCKKSRDLYVPPDLFPNNHVSFTHPDGSKSHLKAVGARLYRGKKYSYYLCPRPRIEFFSDRPISLLLHVRVRITDLEGNLFDGPGKNARRKSLCKRWWNDAWFSRILAISQVLGRGEDISIELEPGAVLTFSRSPDTWQLPVRIREEILGKHTESETLLLREGDDQDGMEDTAPDD